MSTANLGFKIDSSEAKKAAVDLDKLTASSEKAEVAAQDLSTATGKAGKGTADLGAATRASETVIGKTAGTTKKATDALNDNEKALKLNRAGMMELRAAGINSFQALASGMGLFQVASMEGAQVVGAFVQGTEGGLSAVVSKIGTATTAMTAMVGGPLPALAIGLAAAGVAGVAAFGDIEAKTVSSEDAAKEFKSVIAEIGRVSEETARQIKAVGELDPTLSGILAHMRQTREDAGYALNSEITKFESAAKKFQSAAANMMQSANPMEAFQSGFATSGVFASIDEAQQKIGELATGLLSGQMKAQDVLDQLNQLSSANSYPPSLDAVVRQLENIAQKAAEAQAQISAMANLPSPLLKTGARPGTQAYLDELMAKGNRAGSDWKKKLIEGLGDQSVKINAGPYGDFNIPTPTDRPNPESFAPKSASGGAGTSAYKTATQSLRDRTAAIEAQNVAQASLNPAVNDYGYAVDKAKASQQLLNAAVRDHKKITPELTADIEKQADAYARATAAQDRQREAERKAAEQLREDSDTWKTGISTFVNDLEQGRSVWQSFGDAATSVLDKIIDKIENNLSDALANAFSGNGSGGGIGGILGSLFGGGFNGSAQFRASGGVGLFASGTDYAPGGAAIVGEKGPELVNLPRGSQVIPNHRLRQVAANQNGGSTYVDNRKISIDARGAQQGVGDEIKRALAEYDAQVAPNTARRAVNDSYAAGNNLGSL